MTWAKWHKQSEKLASEASLAMRAGKAERAIALYAQSAEAEERAFREADPSKVRTLGITAISAVSLWFKASEYDHAEQLVFSMLGNGKLPQFAVADLRLLLQTLWMESSKRKAGVSFLPGQVVVSIKGGEVIMGGAPLDLIVDKVQTVQALFFRTIEFVKGMPHRVRGGPNRDIQMACRPWLFQTAPGSYQFSVAIQEPVQKDFFEDSIKPDQIAWHFLEILKATVEVESQALETVVPDPHYRSTFLRLSRNLAPTGRTFTQMEIKAAGESSGVVLVPDNRSSINKTIRGQAKPPEAEQETSITGTLRAVHLDKDWLDVTVEGKSIHIEGLQDTIDDVIGPMVNRQVIVRAAQTAKNKLRFLDIELDE